MNADAHFEIGSTHTVCEDYGVAMNWNDGERLRMGEVGEADDSEVVIADGCSDERSECTDFGSRLLCRSYIDHGRDTQQFVQRAYAIAIQLGLTERCLDATFLHLDAKGKVLVFGDGYVVQWTQLVPFSFRYVEIDHHDSPCYLSYALNERRWKRYLEGRKDIGSFLVQDANWTRGEDGVVVFKIARNRFGIQIEGLGDSVWTPTTPFEFQTPHEPGYFTFVMTDGIGTFTRVTETGQKEIMEPELAIARFLENAHKFKVFQGRFVQRLMRRFLKGMKDDGWQHEDDLTIGGIYYGKRDTGE